MPVSITRMHYCLPSGRLTNDDLSQRFDPAKLKSIIKMSGIIERRVAQPDVTAVDLAFQAANHLLQNCGPDKDEIDLLIFTSQTGDYKIPASACLLHGMLQLSSRCAAFDLNLGCSGFPYSLAVAQGMLESGTANKALLLNADTITKMIHPQDRALVPLHGDGAAATLLEKTPESGVAGICLGTDGTGAEHLMIPAGAARKPSTSETQIPKEDDAGCVRSEENLYMNGPAIFHFSVYKVPEIIKDALNSWSLTIDDIDLVILHQANKTMLDLIFRAISVPPEKRFYHIESVGNLSGASTPVALAEAWRQGKLRPGSRTLLVSFGVGLSWGAALLKWPKSMSPFSTLPTDYISHQLDQDNAGA